MCSPSNLQCVENHKAALGSDAPQHRQACLESLVPIHVPQPRAVSRRIAPGGATSEHVTAAGPPAYRATCPAENERHLIKVALVQKLYAVRPTSCPVTAV